VRPPVCRGVAPPIDAGGSGVSCVLLVELAASLYGDRFFRGRNSLLKRFYLVFGRLQGIARLNST